MICIQENGGGTHRYVAERCIDDATLNLLLQERLDKRKPGATVVPIILSSDKTQVTVFRNKSAYPIYLTIGNIPKEIRRKPSQRAYILLGYLPTTRLSHITNQAARRRCIANLFHAAVNHITAPLQAPGAKGMIIPTGDGTHYRAHPIFAVYIGDYPEQVLVTCSITGDCPVCTIHRDSVGADTDPLPLRNLTSILNIFSMVDTSIDNFLQGCADLRIKPVFNPFWEHLSYSNVFHSITPDILHQLYQGVFKHLAAWVTDAYGAAEIDARCRRIPPNHNIRGFFKGISSFSRVTGQEHDQISRFFLSLIADCPLPDGFSPKRLVQAVRGLINFLFIAQYPVHSTSTLRRLRASLELFHANKDVFIDLEIRSNFKIPKLHFLNHYIDRIEYFGSLDNFNTENTERLHIDLAKDAY